MPDPRRETVSASQVAGLFNLSPWVTEYQLFKWFKDGVEAPRDNDRMRLGRLLEDDIIALVAEELRLDVTWVRDNAENYVCHPEHPIGATLDAHCRHPQHGPMVIECKNVDWLRWKQTYTFDDGECVAGPDYYELQLQAQMLATRAERGVLATLVGGNQLELLPRKADPEIHRRIVAKARTFLERVKAGEAPSPYSEVDYELVALLIPEVHTEPPVDLRTEASDDNELLAELGALYNDAKEKKRALEKEEKALKAKLLDFVERHKGAGLIFSDHGKLVTSKGKDSLYTHPQPVADLLRALEDIDEKAAPELALLVRQVRALEENVARKGAIKISWKEW